MTPEQLKERALEFEALLKARKAEVQRADFPWYPYGSLSNIWLFDELLTGAGREVFAGLEGARILDIGAADGELSFFLEQQGARVDILDNAPTNYNGLRGARALKEAFGSPARIFEVDLDTQFQIPDAYDLALFLGILYHLKDPFGTLERLGRRVRRALLSTRVATFDRPCGEPEARDISGQPFAYLLDTLESNNDPTNFWIFTDAGLKRLLHRAGWRVLDYRTFGAVGRSDPWSQEGDERAFVLMESVAFTGNDGA